MKHAIMLGTRPEIIKMSPLIRACENSKTEYFIIHSNQHYSKEMDKIFFDELELAQPKYNLQVGSGSHASQTAKILEAIEPILLEEKPDIIHVQGDTNTVLAGALAASKLGIKISHIEAGLRSYDREMPEEINRIITDHISDYLFPPTKKAAKILQNEGIDTKKIHTVGNTIVDAVFQNLEIAKSKVNILDSLNIKPDEYFLLTMHRPSNVDTKQNLFNIIQAIQKISEKYKLPTIFPIHPRTQKQLEFFNITLPSEIRQTNPIGFLEMIQLENNSRLIFTDSGGIQEEACILQKPCITLRENTERPETVEVGGSILTGSDPDKIYLSTQTLLDRKIDWYNPFGDGDAALKIVKITS